MATQKMEGKFVDWIQRGFVLYKTNFVVLFVATLLAWALSSVIAMIIALPMSFSLAVARSSVVMQLLLAYVVSALSLVGFAVLGGPLFAGLALLTLDLLDRKDPKPGVGDLFKGFEYFQNAFFFAAAWGIISVVVQGLAPLVLSPVLLPVVPVVVSVAVATLSMFGLFLIVDKKMSFQQAFLESIRMVRKRLWLYAGVVVAAGAAGLAGLIACGVGVLLTAPLYGCIVAAVYRDVVKKSP